MQRITEALLAVGILAMMASFSGCGRAQEAVEQAEKAREAVEASEELQEEGKTQIETDEGEVEIASEGAADISDLDIPVYPGAKQQDARTLRTPTVEGIKAEFTSTDTFDDVTGFYQDELSETKVAEFSEGDERRFVLSIEEDTRERGVVVRKETDEDVVEIELVQKVTKTQE